MEPQDRKSSLKSAIDRLLAEEDAAGSTDMYCYAKTVVTSFEEIQSLRTKGMRFDKICKLFETTGFLPENANVHSFRQAFLRESARRNRTNELLRELKDGIAREKQGKKPIPAKTQIPSGGNPAGGVNKKEPNTPPLINQGGKRQEAEVARSREETEEERIKKMMSVTVNTGTGIIVKHPDGSFDYQ